MKHIAKVKSIKEVKGGTVLNILIPNSFIKNKIEKQAVNGDIDIQIELDEQRSITASQRKRYFATLNDIASSTGHQPNEMHQYFKMLYKELVSNKDISMSNCSMTEAKDMINLQIDFVIENNIALSDKILNRIEDIGRYLYLTIINRVCCVCGKSRKDNEVIDIHHCSGSSVGMGRDRKTIDHTGLEVMALCRTHHSECHQIGQADFNNKHHVCGIELDEYAIRKLNL